MGMIHANISIIKSMREVNMKTQLAAFVQLMLAIMERKWLNFGQLLLFQHLFLVVHLLLLHNLAKNQ